MQSTIELGLAIARLLISISTANFATLAFSYSFYADSKTQLKWFLFETPMRSWRLMYYFADSPLWAYCWAGGKEVFNNSATLQNFSFLLRNSIFFPMGVNYDMLCLNFPCCQLPKGVFWLQTHRLICIIFICLFQERLFNPSIPSLGLRNVIYINETHTRYTVVLLTAKDKLTLESVYRGSTVDP